MTLLSNGDGNGRLLKVDRRASVALVLSHLLRGAAVLAPATAALLVAAPAAAQGTGVLIGTVRDAASKGPLADVVVTITSPQMQGEQTVVTDSSGSYRIGSLPPGEYAIHLDKDGYKPGGRGGVVLRVDATIRANMELLPEGLKAEEIVVVGKAPVVDVGSSSTGVNVNSDFTSRIPLNAPGGRNAASRSFEDAAIVAPGAHNDDFGVSINGTTSPENGYLIDGLSVSDPSVGILATPLSIEFVDQVGVITGGYMPEYGRATGGILDAVTKSGSNEFHGSAFATISPGSFEGPRTLIKSNGDAVVWQTKYDNLHDYGATVGGPIVKDKLWFFVGFDYAITRYKQTEDFNYLTLNPQTGNPKTGKDGFWVTTPIPNSTRDYYAQGQAIQVFSKLTYNINQDNHLALSFAALPSRSGGNGLNGLDNQLLTPVPLGPGPFNSQAEQFKNEVYDTSLRYTTSWDNKNWLLDASAGWHHQYILRAPEDGSGVGDNNPNNLSGQPQVIFSRSGPFNSLTDFSSLENLPAAASDVCKTVLPTKGPNGPKGPSGVVPQETCPITSFSGGGPGYLQEAYLDRYQGKAVLTRLVQGLGHHVFKAGIDVEYLHYIDKLAYTGGDSYGQLPDGGFFYDAREFGVVTGPNQFQQLDYYQGASASTNVGGFVQDSWSILDKVTLNLGVRYDGQYIVGDDGRTGISLPDEVSPRVGFVYDFTHEGKSKFYGNFARFYEGMPLDVADRAFPGQSQNFAYHNGSNSYGNHVEAPGTTCNPITQGRKGQACQTAGNVTAANNALFGGASPYAPNSLYSPYAGDPEGVDPNLSPQSNDEWIVGFEYEVFEDGVVGINYTHRYQNSVIEDMSRDEGNTFFIGNPGQGIAKDFPEAIRNYDAMNVYFTKAFSHGWLAQVSYTLSSLRGNWGGLYRAETLQLDPNNNSDFDLRSLLPNRYGPLPQDRTHQFKAFVARDVNLPGNWVLQPGVNFFLRSGDPTNYLGDHVQYGVGEVFVLPRGSGPRLPWVSDFDGHIGVGYHINKNSTLLLGMDVFNIFDFQTVTQIDENFTFNPVSPLPGGKVSDVSGCEGTKAKGACPLIDPTTGKGFLKSSFNPNFGKPAGYQDPREFRFSAKVTF